MKTIGNMFFKVRNIIKKVIYNLKRNGLKATIFKVKRKLVYEKIETSFYQKWIALNEPTLEELKKQKKTKFKLEPKISLIVPLYNTPLNFFNELVESLTEQTYQNWELCLADGSSEKNQEILKIIEKDKRILYKHLNENKGIAENTNEAIKMATGDYMALLDHDDVLPPFSLYEVVKCINENPDVEFIYTDEDKITTLDKPRFKPHFKPDFSLDLLRACNYICHFSIFKKELMDKLVGERTKYDGAQDFDLILRMAENTDKIVHIPKVLYHWRVHPNSTAQDGSNAKTYAFEAGRYAIQDHIDRIGLNGKVSYENNLRIYRIKYEVIGNPKVSILIPNKDQKKVLKKCIDSILKLTTYNNYEIVIIENNSTDEKIFKYYDKLKKNDKIKILNYPEKGFNYSKIINFGVNNTDGDFVVQLNNDTKLETADWLENMIGFAQREDVGAVGVRLYYPNNTTQHAGLIIGVNGVAAQIFKGLRRNCNGYFERESTIQNFSAVTGACMMTKRRTFEEVGYMNEDFPVALNDIDFCLKIRKKGKLIVYNPFVSFIHYESKSRGYDEDNKEKTERFNGEIKKFISLWKDIYEKTDPYYNKNFSKYSLNYEIRAEKCD